MEYYEDLAIDEYNLVEEWKTQPGLFMSYGEETADTQQELDDLSDKIDVLKAKIELEIRQGIYSLAPEGMKITEKAIVALVLTNPKIIVLKEEYNQLKKEVYITKKVEQAFEQRKKALENIVQLTAREQYAEPRDHTKTMQEKSYKTAIDKINDKLKTKR